MVPERVERRDIYFQKPGAANTDEVINAVVKRAKETGINKIVVASDSGETALQLVERVKGDTKIVVISMKRLRKKAKKELEKRNVIIFENCFPIFRKMGLELRKALYMLGQGFKVAVEVVVMATEGGAIRPGEEVIGIGGTARGADTALILKAATPEDMLDGDMKKRLEVREIIAMPRSKRWWE